MDIRKKYPDISFPKKFRSFNEFEWVEYTTPPEYDSKTHRIIEDSPELTEENIWIQSWKIEELNKSDVNQNIESALNTKLKEFEYITENKLDNFAKNNGYRSIDSACSYINSSIEKFSNDAKKCIKLRDLMWIKLYEIFDEIKTGIRTEPSYYEEIEKELPVLTWD